MKRERLHIVASGARTAPGRAPVAFIEIVLDPFPDRPYVDTERLAHQSVRVTHLRTRGYGVVCEDYGTIACERTLEPKAVAKEVRAIRRLLEVSPGQMPRPDRNPEGAIDES